VANGDARRSSVTGPDRPADLVDRNFTAADPNRLWFADFTHLRIGSGVVYVAIIIDAFGRPARMSSVRSTRLAVGS
jgi:putative transposase